MALDRVIEMSVGANGEGLLISDLDIDFKITKSMTFADNFAEFTVYNAKQETRTDILKKDNNIIFKAGYSDETVNTLFVGNIIEAESGKGTTDRVTKIKAISGRGLTGKLQSEYVSLSYNAGTLLSLPIQQLASLYNLVVYGIENAQIKMPNGWSYTGKASGAFRYVLGILKSNNKGMYKDDKELIIFNEGSASKISVVILSYTGGLKTIENVTDLDKNTKTKYKFTSLIIPQCQVNGLVQVVTPDVKGTFTVEKLEYEGNNYGGNFDMSGEIYA